MHFLFSKFSLHTRPVEFDVPFSQIIKEFQKFMNNSVQSIIIKFISKEFKKLMIRCDDVSVKPVFRVFR